jgi:hypothetical protein
LGGIIKILTTQNIDFNSQESGARLRASSSTHNRGCLKSFPVDDVLRVFIILCFVDPDAIESFDF